MIIRRIVVLSLCAASLWYLWELGAAAGGTRVPDAELQRFTQFLERAKQQIPPGSIVEIVLTESLWQEGHGCTRAQFVLTGRSVHCGDTATDRDFTIYWGRSPSIVRRRG